MAKKKETLTPEECLQAALVPESEQPYSVPGNWCWTKGRAFLKPMETKHPEGEVFRYIDIDAIDNKKQQVTEPKTLLVKDAPSRASRKLRTGDTIFSMVRPYLMNIAYIDETISNSIASTGFYVCTPAENVYPLYLYYLMTSPYTVEGLNRYMKGDNSPSIRKDDIENYPYPIPPLAEQQRIVDRIESLLAKLDEAKQKAQDALDSFETRKAAILHKAFAGELTAQWRKEHGTGMESWKEETLESVCYSIFDGGHMPPPKSEQGIPFLVISNVNTGHLSFENTRFVPESYYKALSDTRKPRYGDVLYTLVGSYGIPVIVDSELPFCFQRHMALLKPKNVNSYYLWYILQSREMYEKATQIATGTAQLTVPIKGLRKLRFNCAPTNEQTEIVRILDDLLAKEQQAKEAAQGVLEQIDLIKKAILARAFRGELGTNDPSEESAVELLRQTLKIE